MPAGGWQRSSISGRGRPTQTYTGISFKRLRENFFFPCYLDDVCHHNCHG